MSFNEDELIKIRNATSGWFKGKARYEITRALAILQVNVEELKNLPVEEKRTAIIEMVNDATDKRHAAMNSGASSYGNPEWAAASACESWLHALAGGDSDEIERVEIIVEELIDRD